MRGVDPKKTVRYAIDVSNIGLLLEIVASEQNLAYPFVNLNFDINQL